MKDLEGQDGYKYSGHSAIMGTINREWQDTDYVLGRFSERRTVARRRYREFVEAAVGQGARPELVGGGLLRSHGVKELRRGREKYRSEERILGSTTFIEKIVKEVEKRGEGKSSPVSLDTLMVRICKDFGLSKESMAGGGRNRKVTRA